MKARRTTSFILPSDKLNSLIHSLQQAGYQVVGPVIVDQAIIYDQIKSADDLPQGWTDEQEAGRYRLKRRQDAAYFGYNVGPNSWKKYLQLPRRQVWQAHKTADGIEIEPINAAITPLAFLGVRSCELHAIAIQDRVFLSGEYHNEDYKQRRQSIFTVAVNCTQAAATCFCTSMNTGPAVSLPCDLEITEIINDDDHYFLLRSGSEKGQLILQQLPVTPATSAHQQQQKAAINQAEKQMSAGPRVFDSSDLQALLYRNYENPLWSDIAQRCLSCANCTMVCPTCFCSSVEDTTDLSGDHAERWEQWDSCFTADFSYIHGGSVRPDTRSRYRQWMTHKLATWHEQFNTSGCVGCGRCIAWCPVGIDITEEIVRFRESDTL